jgi:membrane-bound lytic murein transglycosylase D
VKVPPGTADTFTGRLATAASSDFVSLNWYTVKRGETLSSIARKLRVARSELAEANHLSTRAKVRPGQDLIIPRAPATLLAARTERTPPTEIASRVPTANVEPPVKASTAPVTYRVRKGDTLVSIARLFDTTVERLRALNGIRGAHIAPGDRLTIRVN